MQTNTPQKVALRDSKTTLKTYAKGEDR